MNFSALRHLLRRGSVPQVMEPFPSYLLAVREPGRGRAGVMGAAQPISACSRLSNVQNKQAGVMRIAAAVKLFQPWRVGAFSSLNRSGHHK